MSQRLFRLVSFLVILAVLTLEVQPAFAQKNTALPTQPFVYDVLLPMAVKNLDLTPVDMVLVPTGNFQRGCLVENNGGYPCYPDELPSATIYLDAFYIDKTEVTNAQYAKCVAARSCIGPSGASSRTRTSYYGNPTYAKGL